MFQIRYGPYHPGVERDKNWKLVFLFKCCDTCVQIMVASYTYRNVSVYIKPVLYLDKNTGIY